MKLTKASQVVAKIWNEDSIDRYLRKMSWNLVRHFSMIVHCIVKKKEQACIIITGFYYFDTTLVCVMISGTIAHHVQNLNAGPEEQCS